MLTILSQNYGLYAHRNSDTGPEIFKDAPVCLQVISGRLQEERCVAAMKIIDDLVGAREHAQYKFTTRL